MNLDFEKKQLIENIGKLSILVLKEVFIILEKKKINYSSNSNGIFINLKHFNADIINELQKYVLFCKNNHTYLENNIKADNEIINNCNKNNIELIYNFEEYINLTDIDFLNNINIKSNKKNKIDSHMKYINTIKKYNRFSLNTIDNDTNINELTYEKYIL